MATLEELFSAGAFPRTAAFVGRVAIATKSSYERQLLTAAPAWWAAQALSQQPGGGGGILICDVSGGKDVEPANRGKYDYVGVILKGRARYSIKDALLRSPRARRGAFGRYMIVPMRKNRGGSRVNATNNDIAAILKKTGHYSDETSQTRNTYRVFEPREERGEVYGFAQHTKGGIQHSYAKFVVVSEDSPGWYHPAIPANPIEETLTRQVEAAFSTPQFERQVAADIEDFLERFV